MKKILKNGGHCSDGCQWQFCDFWRVETEKTDELYLPKGTNIKTAVEYEIKYKARHYCDLFNVEMSYGKGSLNICNRVYGVTYEGDV